MFDFKLFREQPPYNSPTILLDPVEKTQSVIYSLMELQKVIQYEHTKSFFMK